MLSNNDLKAVCSVTEMAKRVNLSRARFYQLIEAGVFPPPVYCVHTRRPFYTLELQRECIAVRKIGIGHNGRQILFNTPRKNKSGNSQNQANHEFEEIASFLKEMGLNVPLDKVKTAVKSLCPHGLPQHSDKGGLLKELYIKLMQECKRSV